MSSLPAGLLLFDTGIYIRFNRGEKYLWLGEDARVFQRTILTAVVAAELYAGTHSLQEKRAQDELCQAHRALGHFSSLPGSAWIDVGILLRRSRSTFGQVNFASHFRDLLIASNPTAIHEARALLAEQIGKFTLEHAEEKGKVSFKANGNIDFFGEEDLHAWVVPGARHERIATSVSPSRSRHKSFVCYETCACTVQAFIETASPANFRCGAYGSIECRVPHISAPVGDAGIHRECAR